MSLDMDDEILQDFLVEAGEILELLSEQLVDLESSPDNSDLLNAIFRGFHTVKGGAGFLSLTNLVNVCHVAENIFDLLRQQKKTLNPDLMDVILKTLDSINEMFAEIRSGQEPSPAPDELLKQLEYMAHPDSEMPDKPAAESNTSNEQGTPPVQDETKEKVDAPTDETSSEEAKPAAVEAKADKPSIDESNSTDSDAKPSKSGSSDITEEEFEAFLDELSSGKDISLSTDSSTKEQDKTPAEKDNKEEAKKEETKEEVKQEDKQSSGEEASKISDIISTKSQSDEITEDEFDNLLNELSNKKHDKSDVKSEITAKAKPSPPPSSSEPAKPIAKSEAAPIKPNPATPLQKKKTDKETTDTTVRVDTARLDEIMNMVGELVLVRNRLVKLKNENSDENISKAVSNLDVVTGDLQMAVMKTRMQPIKKVFGRFPRVVRDLARSLMKEVNLEMEGEDTDLDKNLVEALSDPLVHLVRNSVDHGIENPDDRVKAGKDKTGKIILAAEQAGDHILLSITDDGKGMDPDFLRQKAVEKGIYDQETADRLDDKDCFNLIFAPGFSTKQEISDISGRGVGMDVVKTKITQLNGSIKIESKKGFGSKIFIKVPLTLAILPTLMVVVGEQTFALPLSSVNEIFHLDLRKTNVVDGQLVISVRKKALPLFYLRSWLAKDYKSTERANEGHVVIVTVGTMRVGFVVDGLLGQEEVVIKALGNTLHGTPGMAGATITGDGKIAMILDVPSLLDYYAARSKIVA